MAGELGVGDNKMAGHRPAICIMLRSPERYCIGATTFGCFSVDASSFFGSILASV
jgi:hypothetical protein